MSDRTILDQPSPPPGDVTAYGSAPHQVFEQYGDPATARAWLVLLHGGFWRERWDRAHLRPLAVALADQGYVVALVEYARTGMPGGGWPGTFEDVAAAVSAVRARAAEEPSPGGQPPRCILLGHSAGGHLAAWLLHQPEAVGVVGAVSLAGCLDLTMAADLDLDNGAAVALMGGTPQDHPERYALADPARLGPSPYPLVVVHGTADEQVPSDLARSWWQANATPGHDQLILLEGMTHFPLIDPGSPSFARLGEALEGLLNLR